MEDAPRYRWVVIGLFWAFSAGTTMGTFALMAILPELRKDLGATPMQSGWLSSVGWLVPAATSMALGTWISRFSPKHSITVSIVLSGICLVVQGWAPTYPLEVAARVGFVLSTIARQPSGALLIQQWFAIRDVTRINSLGNVVASMGQVAAMGLVPVLVFALSGWRSTFYLLGFLQIVLCVIWVIFGKDRMTPEYRARELQQSGTPLRALVKYPSLWTVASCQIGGGLAWAAFLTFMPIFLTEVRGLSLMVAGSLMAIFSAGSIVGSLASGVLSDRLGFNRPIVWTAGLGLIGSYMAMVSIPSIPVVAILLFIAGYFAFVTVPIINTIPYQLPGITPREVAIGLSLVSTLTPLGAASGPLLAGYLQQSTGSLQLALMVCGAGAISIATVGLFLPETGWRARRASPSPVVVEQMDVGGG